mmetsp:Transcript_30800/g.49404  ORF Transcript_30800/g.49404 Transcript_30800/m.49404 type:complete len:504 (-) Transcript_30800:191-1702(-)
MSSSRTGDRGKSLLGAANKESLDSTQIVVDSPSPSEGPLPKNARKKSKISVWDLLRDKPNRSSLFVLYILLITYMFSQVDRYLQPITAKFMQIDQSWGNRKGGGYGEDILVGAVFTSVYLPTGIPMGLLADKFPEHKKYILCCAFALWSLATLATGFTNAYWQVVIFRFALAIGESACTPLAGSIISEHFSRDARTTALGIYNWGIYTGYSLAYGIANYLTDVTSWRTVWWTFGFSGCVWCVFVLLIPKPHIRRKSSSIQSGGSSNKREKEKAASICDIIGYFVSTPSLVILLIASLIRNAGGYVWGYSAAEFFENVDNQDGKQQALYMQWIPLIGGCFGSLLGGYISDRYVKKSEPWKRLLILVTSNLTAAPFAFLALWLPAPYCYFMLIGSNVIGEMWVGICIALVIELVPSNMKTTALSLYFFFIGIAGFFPLLVTPLQQLFCGSETPSCNSGLRWAIIVLFPGLYVLSSGIFFTSMVFLKRDRQKAKLQHAIRLRDDGR